MKSDVIRVTNDGEHIEEALDQAESVAAFKRLPKKEALHLRLLAEEALGVMRALTGKREGKFWIEAKDREFELHLKTAVVVNAKMRGDLLAASSSGKNAAARGFMGKIRDLIERATEPLDENVTVDYTTGFLYSGADMATINLTTGGSWTLSRYRSSVKEETEEWDELEKSIVANLADEVEVSIHDNLVEMIIYKAF